MDDSFTDMEFILSTLSRIRSDDKHLESGHVFDVKLLSVVSLRCPSITELKLLNRLEIDSP